MAVSEVRSIPPGHLPSRVHSGLSNAADVNSGALSPLDDFFFLTATTIPTTSITTTRITTYKSHPFAFVSWPPLEASAAAAAGAAVGLVVGAAEGATVGVAEGAAVGVAVGLSVKATKTGAPPGDKLTVPPAPTIVSSATAALGALVTVT